MKLFIIYVKKFIYLVYISLKYFINRLQITIKKKKLLSN